MSGNRIRSARIYRGLSQAEIARRTGICFSTLSRFEHELCHPSDEQIHKIAEVLKVDEGFLRCGESHEPVHA
jgi:transcriptional regulator with XRE-family HTH domain